MTRVVNGDREEPFQRCGCKFIGWDFLASDMNAQIVNYGIKTQQLRSAALLDHSIYTVRFERLVVRL
jgi:hypothetical protein